MYKLIDYYRNLYQSNQFWFGKIMKTFGFAAAIGAITYFVKPDLLLTIARIFQERFGESPALDIHLALQIFRQNLIVALFALFGGIILGFGSLLVVFINGFLISFVVTSIVILSGENIFQTLILIVGGLVPHGILEIPAFLAAATLGLRLGWEWLDESSANKPVVVFKHNLKQALFQIPVIALALFLAALLEVFVSGRIVNNM